MNNAAETLGYKFLNGYVFKFPTNIPRSGIARLYSDITMSLYMLYHIPTCPNHPSIYVSIHLKVLGT